MQELDVFQRMNEIAEVADKTMLLGYSTERARRLAEHKEWLRNIRRERPNPATPYRIGVYIRYYNQTKYENYLEYHKKQFADTIALCPNWTLVDFYIDEGAVAPNMESAKEWCRLLNDCLSQRVNLIITQKVSNVSRKDYEITFLSRILAEQEQPVGIYFISEDLFTLASYYREDMQDTEFLPPDPEEPVKQLEEAADTNDAG